MFSLKYEFNTIIFDNFILHNVSYEDIVLGNKTSNSNTKSEIALTRFK